MHNHEEIPIIKERASNVQLYPPQCLVQATRLNKGYCAAPLYTSGSILYVAIRDQESLQNSLAGFDTSAMCQYGMVVQVGRIPGCNPADGGSWPSHPTSTTQEIANLPA